MSAPTFQDVIQTLNRYWADQGCVLVQPLDTEVLPGTGRVWTLKTSFRRLGHPAASDHPRGQQAAASGL